MNEAETRAEHIDPALKDAGRGVVARMPAGASSRTAASRASTPSRGAGLRGTGGAGIVAWRRTHRVRRGSAPAGPGIVATGEAQRNPWNESSPLSCRPGGGEGAPPPSLPGRVCRDDRLPRVALRPDGAELHPWLQPGAPSGAPGPSQPGGRAADHGSRVAYEFAPTSCNTAAARN